MPRLRRRNHSDEVPYGEWIPSHAVRINDDGTVDVMTEGALSNPGIEDLRDGRVYVYMTNFGYYAQEGFDTLREAIKWAQSRGFEAQFVRDGNQLGSWTPFGGVRLKHQYEHEYYARSNRSRRRNARSLF